MALNRWTLALGLACAARLACAASMAAFTQAYPSKPVTMFVPFATGGGTDIGARLVAQKLPARWGQNIKLD